MAVWLGHAGPPGPTGPVGPTGPMGPSGDFRCHVNGGVAPLFNGSTGWVSTPYIPSAVTSLTLMLWVYVTGSITNTPRLTGAGHTDTDGHGWQMGWISSNSQVQIDIGTTSGNPTATGPSLTTYQWYCLIGWWNGSTLTLYVNNNPYGSQGIGGTLQVPSHNMGIAISPAWVGQYFPGMIAHVAYWSGTALTTAQRATLYANGLNMTPAQYQSYVSSLSPTVYYPLQETSGTTATNVGTSGSANNGTYEGGVTLAQTPGIPLGLPVLVTSPPAASTVTLTSGTAWQNTTGADVWLYVPVTFSPTASAAASVALGVGATATPSTSTVAAEPAGTVSGAVHTVTAYVPANFYALLTTTNATLGTATVQPA